VRLNALNAFFQEIFNRCGPRHEIEEVSCAKDIVATRPEIASQSDINLFLGKIFGG
jgi:hypothetical protein